MSNVRDYTGKTIYVGIDVHKKTYSCASICDNETIKRDSMPADSKVLLQYLRNSFPGAEIKSAYEAGFSGFYLHRYLVKNSIKNIVVHPGSIEVSSRDRVKTDKRDALKIATQLSANRLNGVFIPCEEQEARRTVSRLRHNILKLRSQIGNQLKSLLFTQGLIDREDDTRLNSKWLTKKQAEVKTLNHPSEFVYTVEQYALQWKTLNTQLKTLQTHLKQQSLSNTTLQTIYESVPGIGPLHGRELANELGDMQQFRNEKQLFSYTGLTPSEYSSGEHVRQGNISRQGRSIFRKILIEAAWVAITKDQNLQTAYDRISKHRGKKRAIVGVARRLAGRIRTCLTQGVMYEIKPIQQKTTTVETICATS